MCIGRGFGVYAISHTFACQSVFLVKEMWLISQRAYRFQYVGGSPTSVSKPGVRQVADYLKLLFQNTLADYKCNVICKYLVVHVSDHFTNSVIMEILRGLQYFTRNTIMIYTLINKS